MDLLKKFNELSAEGRKGVLFLLALVAAILFLWMPSPSSLLRLVPSAPPARPVKPSPFDDRLNAPPRAVPPQRAGADPSQVPFSNAPPPVVRDYVPPVASPGLSIPGRLLGNFQGKNVVRKRGMCGVSVEMYEQEESGDQVVAYTTVQCTDAGIFLPRNGRAATPDSVYDAVGKFMPVPIILNGTREGTAIRFHAEKTVGESDCSITEATMTAFGARAVLFEWEEGKCGGGGQMILTKIGM